MSYYPTSSSHFQVAEYSNEKSIFKKKQAIPTSLSKFSFEGEYDTSKDKKELTFDSDSFGLKNETPKSETKNFELPDIDVNLYRETLSKLEENSLELARQMLDVPNKEHHLKRKHQTMNVKPKSGFNIVMLSVVALFLVVLFFRFLLK